MAAAAPVDLAEELEQARVAAHQAARELRKAQTLDRRVQAAYVARAARNGERPPPPEAMELLKQRASAHAAAAARYAAAAREYASAVESD